MKKIIGILTISWALFWVGCTTSGTSWDVDAYAPVAETTLDLNKLVGDSNLQVLSDSAVWLNIDETAFSFALDTLTQFPNFVVPYNFIWPFSVTLPSGNQMPQQEIPINLLATGVEMREVKLKSGKLKLTVKSTASQRVIFTYSSPAASLGGVSFTFTDTLPGLLAGQDTLVYVKEFDVSGFNIVTTGPNNDQLNTFSTFIDAKTISGDPDMALVGGQLLFNVNNELVNLVPDYGKGYLGQYDFSQTNVTTNLDVLKSFRSGLLDIEQLTVSLAVHNYIGADVRFKPVFFTATNTNLGTSLSLTHPGMGNTVNINRAFETGNSSNPIIPNVYTYNFNGGNSNVEQMVELLPDKLNFTAEMKLNPYGNIGGYTDFYYLDYPAYVQAQVQAPLKFSLSQLMFIDTMANPFASLDFLDNVIDGEFVIRAENKFPIAMNLQLYTLDSMDVATDSIVVNDLIQAAPVNAMNRVVAPLTTDLIVAVDASKISHLRTAKNIRIKARFNTLPAAAGRLQMYIDYYLKIKLIADIKYHIVL